MEVFAIQSHNIKVRKSLEQLPIKRKSTSLRACGIFLTGLLALNSCSENKTKLSKNLTAKDNYMSIDCDDKSVTANSGASYTLGPEFLKKSGTRFVFGETLREDKSKEQVVIESGVQVTHIGDGRFQLQTLNVLTEIKDGTTIDIHDPIAVITIEALKAVYIIRTRTDPPSSITNPQLEGIVQCKKI